MVRNLQRGAVLSTSSADTGLHGGATGTCISLIYYLADKKTILISIAALRWSLDVFVVVQVKFGFPHKHGRREA